MTLNELQSVMWASNVSVHISEQKGSQNFKGFAAACEQFGGCNVLGVYSSGNYSTSVTVEVQQ